MVVRFHNHYYANSVFTRYINGIVGTSSDLCGQSGLSGGGAPGGCGLDSSLGTGFRRLRIRLDA